MSGGASVLSSIAGFGLRRLSRVMSEGFGNKGDVGQSRHYSDPLQQSGLNNHSFFHTARLLQGVVTDATSLGHCYRVQLEKAHSPITCFCGGLSSFSSVGARDISTIQVGSRVLVAVHRQTYYGIIICTLPHAGYEARLQLHGILNQATRNRVDEAHQQPYKQGGKGIATSWTSGRHFDATTVGEKGWMTETGGRIFLDPFMAQFAVDEACGVFAFYHDQLLKIAGYNLRMFSAGMEREGIDDQEEYNDWTGYTPYPWEQLGLFERKDPRREYNAQAWQIDEPYYSIWEPKVDAQCPWHREREYHGYLGQGGKRTVCTKPVTPPEYAEFLQDNVQFPGLADDFTGLDGFRALSSAKGFSIVKRAAVQAPVRRYTPEQISFEGDEPTNYKHSGIVGDGPDHVIKGQIETRGTSEELNRAAGVLDLHAYWFNYGTFHPFFYHARDWNVFSEGTLEHLEQATIQVPNYGTLEGSMFLRAPTPIELEIDHRYGKVKYWQNESGIDWLEDGGLCLYDGWGTEIKMTAGSGWFSAPADVWINPGRNVNIWGGDDVNIRAKNSVDIVATNKDMRLKAEKNQHFLSGNGGEGGTLIESRGADNFQFQGKTGEDVISGGVFLRATKGTVGGWGKNIYWRAGGGDIEGGAIMLDGDEGQVPLIINANEIVNFVPGGESWHFNCVEGSCETPSASLTTQGTAWPGTMCNGGAAIFGGQGVFDGDVLTTSGFAAVNGAPFIGQLEGESLAKVQEAISTCRQTIEQSLPNRGSEFLTNTVERLFYEDNKPGNEDVIKNSEFSLRSVTQYGTQEFQLYESRWQQMGRLAGTLTNTWQEKPVACRTDPTTYPYPGKTHFQGSSYYEQDTNLFQFNGTRGAAKDHGQRPTQEGQQPTLDPLYREPTYATPVAVSLDMYKVIRS